MKKKKKIKRKNSKCLQKFDEIKQRKKIQNKGENVWSV